MYLKIKPKKSSRDQYEGFVYPQTVNLSGNHRCCWNMCIRPAIIVRYILIQFSSNRRLWCPTDCCDIRRSPERCDNRADSSVVVAPVCSLCDIWFEKWRIFLWKLLIPKFARKKWKFRRGVILKGHLKCSRFIYQAKWCFVRDVVYIPNGE